MYTFVLKVTQNDSMLYQITTCKCVILIKFHYNFYLYQMVAFSYLHSLPSRDGEELGLSCSGATQLFKVNIIVCIR